MKAQGKIMRAAWQLTSNQISRWAWALLGLMLLTPLVLSLWHGGWSLFVKVGSAELALLGFSFWMMLFSSLWQQNHPHAARLVPGHVRRLRQVLLANWLGLIVFNTALLGGQFGAWQHWALGSAALLLVGALLVRWPWLWLQGWLVFLLLAYWRPAGFWRALFAQAAQDYAAAPTLLLAAMLLLAAWPLSRLLQTGGPAHRHSYAKAKLIRMAMELRNAGRPPPLMQGGHVGVGLWRVTNAPLQLWRQHLLNTARPSARSVLARAELALGAHWTLLFTGLLFFGVLAGLGLGLAYFFAGAKLLEMLKHAGFGISLGLASMVINPVLGLPAALHGSRREQALLMLLPGMPQGAALNRQLARRRLLQFGAYWVILVLLLLLVPRSSTPADGPWLMMAALPLGLLALRDWSRLPQPGTQFIVLGLFGWMLAGGALLGLQRWLDIPPTWGFSLIVLVTLAAGVWRWRKLAGYRQAFPVGRWAS